MWPFEKAYPKVEPPQKSAGPHHPSFEEIMDCPLIYGIVMISRLEIGIGSWPVGTPELSRDYVYRLRPQPLIAGLPIYTTYEETVFYLLDHEHDILKGAFCLSPGVLETKATLILQGKYPRKQENKKE